MKQTQISRVVSAMPTLLGLAVGIAIVTPSASAQTASPHPHNTPMMGDHPAPPARPMAGDPMMDGPMGRPMPGDPMMDGSMGRPMPGDPMMGGPMQPRPPAPMMGGTAITVSGPFVFVVQNNMLYQFSVSDLKMIRQAPLGPMPMPMQGMAPQPMGAPGAMPPAPNGMAKPMGNPPAPMR